MSDIYTRSGDDGSTSIVGGKRVSKSDPHVAFYGALDEANCAIGFARVHVLDSGLDAALEFLQQRLFNCAACALSPKPAPGAPRVDAADTATLEAAIDHYSDRVGGFKGFVLPGCDEDSTRLHLARTAVRRAEREAVALAATEPLDHEVLAFLNRASDLLYAGARWVGDGGECAWNPDLERPTY
jgi:cob(I)alamin adenosyltransferase